MRTSRRVLIWTAIPLLVGQVGCAARGGQLPPPAAAPAPPIAEAERRACETYADKQPSKSVVGRTLAGLLLVPLGAGGAVLGIMGGRLDGLVLPLMAFEPAAGAARENRATRERALAACLEPVILTQTLGPEHPDVARSLARLADGYEAIGDVTQAEALYQRALAIQETALGRDHLEVAATLDTYAFVLRQTHRESQAANLEARASAIRASQLADAVPDVVIQAERMTAILGDWKSDPSMRGCGIEVVLWNQSNGPRRVSLSYQAMDFWRQPVSATVTTRVAARRSGTLQLPLLHSNGTGAPCGVSFERSALTVSQ